MQPVSPRIVELFNERGRCQAVARLSEGIMAGAVRLSTGAWFDPAASVEAHGNPNMLTLDKGSSRLAQSCIAQSALVEIERYDGELADIFDLQDEITRNVRSAADRTRTVSASINDVASETGKTGELSGQVLSTAQTASEKVENLRSRINGILEDLRQQARDRAS